jgi:hypothetical protein
MFAAMLVASMIARPGTGNAQDSTPEAAMGPVLPLAPDPATWCTVTPKTLAEVRAAWEEVNAEPSDATPLADPAPFERPTGTPADDATVAAITAAIVQVIACSANGGNGLADAALSTDTHLRDSNNLLGMAEEDFNGFYTETPMASGPEQWLMVYAVHDVTLLEDGRVGVRPDIIVPGVGRFCNDYLIFEEVDGQWLIDLSYYGAPCTAE